MYCVFVSLPLGAICRCRIFLADVVELVADVFTPFNPFKSNGISHFYQLDQSISVLRVVGWYFFVFIQTLIRAFCKETVENLIRRHLIWVCTVCQCPTKRWLGLRN